MGEGRSAIKIIGIGCGILFLLAVLGGGTCGYFIYTATKPPADAAHAFLADLRTGNVGGALARTSVEYQAAHPLPTFQQTIASAPALTANTDATFSSRNIQNATAQVSGTLTTMQGEVPIVIELVSAPDFWRITSITVNGMRLP